MPTWYKDKKKPLPARGQPMPQTLDAYKALAARELELIMEMKVQASKDSVTINNLRQRLNKGKS